MVSAANCAKWTPCSFTMLRKNLATAKIVKIEYNANLDLLGFSPFYNI